MIKTNADKLLNHFINTARCNICKNDYPRRFPDCPYCDHADGEALGYLIDELNDETERLENE